MLTIGGAGSAHWSSSRAHMETNRQPLIDTECLRREPCIVASTFHGLACRLEEGGARYEKVDRLVFITRLYLHTTDHYNRCCAR